MIYVRVVIRQIIWVLNCDTYKCTFIYDTIKWSNLKFKISGLRYIVGRNCETLHTFDKYPEVLMFSFIFHTVLHDVDHTYFAHSSFSQYEEYSTHLISAWVCSIEEKQDKIEALPHEPTVCLPNTIFSLLCLTFFFCFLCVKIWMPSPTEKWSCYELVSVHILL